MSERTYLANLSDGRANADEQRMGGQWIVTLEAGERELQSKLRKLEGNYAHPENRCDRCGGRNISSWYADSDVWNKVAGDYSILCPICFSELATILGVAPTAWRLSIEGDDPEISKVRTQLHDSLNEGAKLYARVAQLEHEVDCYWYDLAAGEWALAHCEECKRLDDIVKNTARLGNPSPPTPATLGVAS